jgi:hypothetical protein
LIKPPGLLFVEAETGEISMGLSCEACLIILQNMCTDMIALADAASRGCEDDECLLLYATVRDSAYKIHGMAGNRMIHIKMGFLQFTESCDARLL